MRCLYTLQLGNIETKVVAESHAEAVDLANEAIKTPISTSFRTIRIVSMSIRFTREYAVKDIVKIQIMEDDDGTKD
jgi:hypothetical protein